MPEVGNGSDEIAPPSDPPVPVTLVLPSEKTIVDVLEPSFFRMSIVA